MEYEYYVVRGLLTLWTRGQVHYMLGRVHPAKDKGGGHLVQHAGYYRCQRVLQVWVGGLTAGMHACVRGAHSYGFTLLPVCVLQALWRDPRLAADNATVARCARLDFAT